MKIRNYLTIGLMLFSINFFGCTNAKKARVDKPSEAVYNVYFFVSAECPLCKNYLPEWKKIMQEFNSSQFNYKLVRCNLADTIGWNDMVQNINLESITNNSNNTFLSKKYDIETVPSILITDVNGNKIYQGATDDRIVETGIYKPKASKHYLKEVLAKLQKGDKNFIKNRAVAGCYIED